MKCHSCESESRFADLPIRERIATDDHWRVAHAINTALPGWLVLVPRRHVTTIADLTDTEAATLGTWQVRVSRALTEVTGCVKTYVAQFAEAPGFSHVHFHLIPRPPDLAPDRIGPAAFAFLNAPEHQRVSDTHMNALATALATHLPQPT